MLSFPPARPAPIKHLPRTSLTFSTEGDYNACALSALYGLNSFQAGSAYYTQGLGILKSFIGDSSHAPGDQVINLPKLDYQINDRNRLSLMYNRMRYSAPNGLYPQTSVTEGRSGWGNDTSRKISASLG